MGGLVGRALKTLEERSGGSCSTDPQEPRGSCYPQGLILHNYPGLPAVMDQADIVSSLCKAEKKDSLKPSLLCYCPKQACFFSSDAISEN